MAENIELKEGFLPLVTEGSIIGGKYDTRTPHLPENVALFSPAPNNYEGQKYSKSSKGGGKFDIFVKDDAGSYAIKTPLNSQKWSLNGNEADSSKGEVLGTYPSYSGLTIGLGCDVGASYSKASQVESLFNKAKLPQFGKILGEAAGLRGIPALLVTKKLKPLVKLTQQQVLDLQNAMWSGKAKMTENLIQNGGKDSKGKVYFPKGLIDYNKLYDPLKQVLIRCTYGSWKSTLALVKRLKGIDSLQGTNEQQTWIMQCDKLIAAMEGYNKDNKPRKGHQPKYIGNGGMTLIKKIKATLEAGGSVTIQKGPIQVNDIISPNSVLGDWMTEIYKDAKATKKDFRQELLVKNIQLQLNNKNYKDAKGKELKVDGAWGSNTLFALNAFEEANGLKKSSSLEDISDASYKKLLGNGISAPTDNNSTNNNDTSPNNTTDNNTPSHTPPTPVGKQIAASVGEGGKNDTEDVRIVQQLLVDKGFDLGAYGPKKDGVDGDYGNASKNAILKFQTDNGLPADGLISPNNNTWLKLTGQSIPNDNQDGDDDNTNNDNNAGGGGLNDIPKGDKDVVLAKGVVQLITEGNIAGGKSDTRRPHFPQNVSYFKKVTAGQGNFILRKPELGVFKQEEGGDYIKGESFKPNETAGVAMTKGEWVLGTWLSRERVGSSGVTIGQGYDIGAKYDKGDEAKAKKRMLDAGIPEDYAEALSKKVGIQGIKASPEASKLRAQGIQITQDSIVRLLILSVQDYGDHKKLSYTNIHPSLEDTARAMCYAKGTGGAISNGLDDTLNAMRGKSNVEQCTIMIAWLESKGWKKQAKHVTKLKATFEAGGDVIMAEEFTLKDLMAPDNDLAAWVGDVKGVDFKQQVRTSRAQQVLIDQGILNDIADGKLGSKTEAALKEYQKRNGLTQSGDVDDATMEHMFGKFDAPNNNTTLEPVEVSATTDENGDLVFVVPDAMAGEFGCFH